MRIFLAGGSGLVGSRLTLRLLERDDRVVLLTRNEENARRKMLANEQIAAQIDHMEFIEGNPAQGGDWMSHVAGCDAVVNLVGEGIFAHRWNDAVKRELRESRLHSTTDIVEAIRLADPKPGVLVNASAIGFYGFHESTVFDEDSPPGDDFLAQLCVEWEAAAMAAEKLGVRTAIVRVGVVMDKEGGALAKMALPIKMGVGGKVGRGKQWVSWIHHDDLCSVIITALENPDARGPVNGTAPQPVTNLELTKALGAALHRPTVFPVPAFMLHLSMGEVAEIITKGQKVLPKRAEELGCQFRYPEINAALGEIYAP